MAGGFAGSANSAGGRFLPVYRCNSPLEAAPADKKKMGFQRHQTRNPFIFCRASPSIAVAQWQCSDLWMEWCRSSDCACLPNARGRSNTGLAHALPRDLHTAPVPHTDSTRVHHLADASTSHVGALAATLPVPSPARPCPVPHAHCAEPWSLSAFTTPHWHGLAPVCRYATARAWHAAPRAPCALAVARCGH